MSAAGAAKPGRLLRLGRVLLGLALDSVVYGVPVVALGYGIMVWSEPTRAALEKVLSLLFSGVAFPELMRDDRSCYEETKPSPGRSSEVGQTLEERRRAEAQADPARAAAEASAARERNAAMIRAIRENAASDRPIWQVKWWAPLFPLLLLPLCRVLMHAHARHYQRASTERVSACRPEERKP